MQNLALKTVRLFTLPVLALSVAFSSLSAATKAPTVTPATDSVSGRVTAAGTSPAYGIPGANLTLLLSSTSSKTAVTSSTGAYSFTSLPSTTKGLMIDSIDNYYLNLSDAVTVSPGNNTVNMLLYPKITAATTSAIAPTITRVWTVTNPIPVPVTFTYTLSSNPGVKGTFTVAGLKSVSFSTPTQSASNILQVYVANVLVATAGK